MRLELFVLDDNTRLVDINKPWVSTIKEFKKLITRDKGTIGDREGRRKLQATREFTFIYHYCDYGSKFTNYEEEDKRAACLSNADLDINLDIQKDEDLLNAIVKYKSLQQSPSLTLLNELKEGIHTAHKVVKKVRVNLESKLASMDFDTFEEGENPRDKVDPITRLTSSLDLLMNLTKRLPETLNAIEALEEKVKKQLSDTNQVRGGAELGIRENAKVIKLEKPNEEEKDIFDDL